MCRFNSGVGVSITFRLMITSVNGFFQVFLPPRIAETLPILLEVSEPLLIKIAKLIWLLRRRVE